MRVQAYKSITKEQAASLLGLRKEAIIDFLRERSKSKQRTHKPKQKKPTREQLIGREKLSIINEFREGLVENATKSEIAFKAILDKLKVKYNFQHKFASIQFKCYIADFYIPNQRIVFEVDGGYHNTKEQRKKDATRTKDLRTKYAVKAVVRFTDYEVMNNEGDVVKRILKNIEYYSKQ